MKKKYIIALEDRNVWTCGLPAKTLLLSDVSIFGTDLSSVNTGIELTPYTEPDLEQVNREKDALYDEARARGYDEGRARGYQEGLFDAWECARKVMWTKEHGGYGDRLEDVFGHHSELWDVFDYSASEAIEKIRQYEQEKEEIKVGDEVKSIESDWTAIVTKSEEGHLTLMGDSGAIANGYDAKYFAKTGRHFPEIAEVLKKMRGDAPT